MKISTMVCTVWVLACLSADPTFAASCESLAALALKDTTITMAELVPAGRFQAPGAPQTVLLERLLDRREARAQGGADVSR